MRAAREAERRRSQWRRFRIRRSTPRGRAPPRLPTHPRLLWQHVELRQRLELVLAGLIHEVLVRRLWARRQRLDPSPVARHHDVLRLGLVVLEPHDLALCDRRGREQPAPVLAALGVVAHDHRRVEHHRRPRRSGARQGSPPKPYSTRIPSLAPRPGRGGAAPGALGTARAVATIYHPSGNALPLRAAAAGRWAAPVFIFIFIFTVFLFLNPHSKCVRYQDARLRSHRHTKGYFLFLFLNPKDNPGH